MEKEWLYLLLTLEGLVILLLLATILYYRRELFRCRLRLVRFIHANLEMKEKLPYNELPHCLRAADEMTAEEFYSIVKKLMKRFLLLASFLLLLFNEGTRDELTRLQGVSYELPVTRDKLTRLQGISYELPVTRDELQETRDKLTRLQGISYELRVQKPCPS